MARRMAPLQPRGLSRVNLHDGGWLINAHAPGITSIVASRQRIIDGGWHDLRVFIQEQK